MTVRLLLVFVLSAVTASPIPNTLPTLTYDVAKNEITGIELLSRYLLEMLKNVTLKQSYSLSISTNLIPNSVMLNGTITTLSNWSDIYGNKSQRHTVHSGNSTKNFNTSITTNKRNKESIDSFLLDVAREDQLKRSNIYRKSKARQTYTTLMPSTDSLETSSVPFSPTPTNLNTLIRNFVASLQQLFNNSVVATVNQEEDTPDSTTAQGIVPSTVTTAPFTNPSSTYNYSQVSSTENTDLTSTRNAVSSISPKMALLNNDTIELLAAAVADTVKILQGDNFSPTLQYPTTTTQISEATTKTHEKWKKFAVSEPTEKCRKMLRSVIQHLKDNLQKDTSEWSDSYHKKVARTLHDDNGCSEKLNEYLQRLAFLTARQLRGTNKRDVLL